MNSNMRLSMARSLTFSAILADKGKTKNDPRNHTTLHEQVYLRVASWIALRPLCLDGALVHPDRGQVRYLNECWLRSKRLSAGR